MVHYHITDCQWLPANHFLFQLANICLVFSYLVPDTMNGLFLLRFWLGSAGLFFGLWGWFILCAPDTFGWNVVFMFFNYAHFVYLLIKVRRPRKFSEECEIAYKELFEPLGVMRYQFHLLATKSFVLKLPAGDIFAEENTQADRISILLSGSVEVSKDNQILHITKPYEFVNSPEWAAGESGETAKYGVTLTVRESMTSLTWDTDTLRKILKKDRFLTNVFNALVGQDVTKKLLRISGNVTDIRTEDLRNYRTGSIVYMHKATTDIAVYSEAKLHNTPKSEALVRSSTPVFDISQIGAALRNDDIDDDNMALIRSSSVSPQTPSSNGGAHLLRRPVNSLPAHWQESTILLESSPLVQAVFPSAANDVERQTVL